LVAGFSDPAELEPERRPGGSPDLRQLARLLTQPLAALAGPGYDKPVWHCAVRAAPGDRNLSDAEWAQVTAGIMDRTGLAPAGDELGVRWVAVRHATDHVHIVATLARQDGIRPKVWNDFYRVREACQDAERRFGLTATAPADRTAPRRPARAETEQSARRGWDEVPRDRLRREVCEAAAGARSEQEFFAGLAEARVLVRKRHSTLDPGAVTGYAVGLPSHAAKNGGTIWYGGGKLAADLSLPKLRCRWAAPGGRDAPFPGHGLPPAAARGVLRAMVTRAAEQTAGEAGFFARLRDDGVLVRLRFSERDPGQVTGYAVGLPDSAGAGAVPVWYGGGRLAAGLSLPRLRRRWSLGPSADADQRGARECPAAEREAIFEHAARHAATAAEHILRCARDDPAQAADAAWAAAGTLHVAARATRSRVLRCAADAYDRAARATYGRILRPTQHGNELRAAARLIALTGRCTGDDVLLMAALAARLAVLVAAVAELRQAQRHAAQAAAARAAAEHLHAASARVRWPAPHLGQATVRKVGRTATAVDVAGRDFPMGARDGRPGRSGLSGARPRRRRGTLPRRRAGPGR